MSRISNWVNVCGHVHVMALEVLLRLVHLT